MTGLTNMEPIEVVALFSPDGSITPTRFKWQGDDLFVSSIGRRWVDGAGHHILVLDPNEQVFELLYVPGEMHWYIKIPQGRWA